MSFFRTASIVFSGQILVVIIGVINQAIFSRTLGPDGMGQFDLLRIYGNWATAVGSIGIGNAGIYFLNAKGVSRDTVVPIYIKMAVFVGGFSAIVSTILFLGFPAYWGPISAPLAISFALSLSVNYSTVMVRGILVADLDGKRMFLLSILRPLVILAGAGVMFFIGYSASRLIFSQALAFFAIGGYAWWCVRKSIRWAPIDWPLFSRMVKYGIKHYAANIFFLGINMAMVTVFRLFTLEDDAQIGYLTRATALATLVIMIPRMLGPLLFSKWSGMAIKDKVPQVERVVRINALIAIMMIVVLVVGGKWIILFLYGGAFLAAFWPVVIMGIAAGLVGIFTAFSDFMASANRPGISALFYLLMLIVTFVGLFTMTPLLGIIGATTSVLVAHLVGLIAIQRYCKHQFGVRTSQCLWIKSEDYRWLLRKLRRTTKIES